MFNKASRSLSHYCIAMLARVVASQKTALRSRNGQIAFAPRGHSSPRQNHVFNMKAGWQ